MKVIILLCFVALSNCSVPLQNRECYYDDRGLCMGYCEAGTHSYTTGCGPMTPEPTCDNPRPTATDYDICDYSACYCNPPTVRDTATNKCVLLKDCLNNYNTILHKEK